MDCKSFFLPCESLFGPGCLRSLGEELRRKGVNKALLVTDKGVAACGVAKKVTDMLEENRIAYVLYAGVEPNPTLKNVELGVAAYRREGCDFLIALGGGSPNDCAKAIGILLSNGGDLHDYQGLDKSLRRAPPIIAINTTAGTASEISRAYLITDEETQVKMIMNHRNCMADIAVNDPELMTGLPGPLTAATGMDALTHAVESYVSTRAFPLTRAFARESVEMIFRYLPQAVRQPGDLEAREQMTYAQYLAGMSFGNGGLGLVHSMAHPLGAVYHLGHGICNAVLLPHVVRFNTQAAAAGYAELADFLWPAAAPRSAREGAQLLLEKIRTLSEEVGTLIPLRQLGVRQEDLPMLAEKALADGNLASNPVQPTPQQVEQLYREAL